MTASRAEPVAASHPLAAFGAVGMRLLRSLEAGRIAPSYLLEGSDPEGLEELALTLAASVLAGCPPAPATGRAYEIARRGAHPDLHRLERDKPTVISVAALTAVLERAHATPLESSYQVFLIQPAEAMEPEGIARYLKTLEEPPRGTIFLLLSVRPERLPATVLSRCRRVRLPPLSTTVVAERLEADGVEPETAARAARACGCSLSRARRIASAGLYDIAASLVRAGLDTAPHVGVTANEAYSALQRASTEAAAAESRSDLKREYVRRFLIDTLYLLCVEARERAADRPSELLRDVAPDHAATLLRAWGELAALVPANVTPAVLVIEAAACLRRERPRSR